MPRRHPVRPDALHPRGLALAAVAALALGCAAPGAATPEDPCAAAVDRLLACGLVDERPPPGAACDPAEASTLADASCDELETTEAAGKADGVWDTILCHHGFRSRCPLGPPVWDAASARFDRYELPGARLHPEGGAYDPVEGAFYVGSLSDGSVLRVDEASAEVTVVSPPEPDDWRTLGAAVDVERRRLFICAIHDVDPQHGEVWEIALGSGARTRHDLRDAAPNGSCNDVAVAPNGDVYVTDREQPNLYRIDATGAVSLFASHELLAPPRLGLGQNGIVVLDDGAGIVTTTYLPPRLNHVSMDGRAVTRVEVDGDFSDYENLGSGADGMVAHDGGLYVAFSTELVRVDGRDGWARATTRSVGMPRGGMTDVISTGDALYALNGQAVAFVRGKEPRGPFALFRVDELP